MTTIKETQFLERIKLAIALNRIPGYHFCGNFFGINYDEVAEAHSELSIETTSLLEGSDGQMSLLPFAVTVDMGLATGVRANLDGNTRLATVSLNLQMTGAPRVGRIEVSSRSQEFIHGIHGRQGISQARVTGPEGLLCMGTGTFMVLAPMPNMQMHPVPWFDKKPPSKVDLDLATLSQEEQVIWDRAQRVVDADQNSSFSLIDRFFGIAPESGPGQAYCELENGTHVANRVGHVQGGITLGMAIQTAKAALNPNWVLVGVSASYIAPGEGETIFARSTVIHQGKMTAVVRTEVMNNHGRQVLEVMTQHSSS